jgi:predicted enzyme related to lactoylglutathione lyase
VGWHELLAADWEKALAFHGELFGWQKADAHIGSMGTYQQFSAGGETIGGMYTKPATLPVPFWLYYFNISDIGTAAKRVEAGGGQILYGPTARAGRRLDRALHGPSGRHIRAPGQAQSRGYRLFRVRRIGRCFRRA